MSQPYVNSEKSAENEIPIKNKSDLDLETLIKNRNLKNVNIFKTNTQVTKNNDKRWQLNPNFKNEENKNLINKKLIENLGLQNQVKIEENIKKETPDKRNILDSNSKYKLENNGCLIKNPFEDKKFITEIDLNSMSLNNPFQDTSLKNTGNNETTISDLSNKREVNKNEGNITGKVLQVNNLDNKINENLIIIKDDKPPTFGRSDSLINNIHSAYPLNTLEKADNYDELDISNRLVNSSSNINLTITDPHVSKYSNEFTPSKITISSLHLKESSFKFGTILPFGLEREKSKFNEEEYTIPDDIFFRNYSSFFNQNSYLLPKKESELIPISEHEKNMLNMNYKYRRSSSINRKESFISNLQLKNEISIEYGAKLDCKEPPATSNMKPSVSFYFKKSEDNDII